MLPGVHFREERDRSPKWRCLAINGVAVDLPSASSTRTDQIVISAQNWKFPGRSGPGQLYLANPLTVGTRTVVADIVEYESSQELQTVLP
jgi:hypothetical protein